MKGTVLVIDDEAAVLELTALFLNKIGFTVLTCDSASTALEKFEKAGCDIDLMITDLKLPDGSGLDLAVRLKKRAPGIKTLLVSGYALEDRLAGDMATVRRLGSDSVDFLGKPYSGQELLERIQQLMERAAVQPAKNS